MHVVDVLQK
uniref:Uncharacterized protein n=1 Tax=Moniliophthora roreri TaxID=221103 RepID=A0A0W0FT89_MONRR